MSSAPENNGRRRFLTLATAVVGGAGTVGVAVPFIKSWNPSEKAKAAGAPVEYDVSKMSPGQLVRVKWRGKPVYVVRRTDEVLEQLKSGHNDQLKDPDSIEDQQPEYAVNSHRSPNPEFLVALGVCTHLGCAPTYRAGDFNEIVEGVANGFFCPCHGSKFDMAGRVFNNVPAPLNLVVPPHSYLDNGVLLIGVDKGDA
ncbi:ubiquinol-cytochrome c reductase iron-sulfur subunit [Psychrobium sp. nBUS_13]|uniref:ubiquinol-cytochrome c reductase iron-sulfur subunit n=1 Tax=Psychrobium sp. nBUS_13 TaxID=3395319 RepID=UPI003EC029E6